MVTLTQTYLKNVKMLLLVVTVHHNLWTQITKVCSQIRRKLEQSRTLTNLKALSVYNKTLNTLILSKMIIPANLVQIIKLKSFGVKTIKLINKLATKIGSSLAILNQTYLIWMKLLLAPNAKQVLTNSSSKQVQARRKDKDLNQTRISLLLEVKAVAHTSKSLKFIKQSRLYPLKNGVKLQRLYKMIWAILI